jgi:hypothetical protein
MVSCGVQAYLMPIKTAGCSEILNIKVAFRSGINKPKLHELGFAALLECASRSDCPVAYHPICLAHEYGKAGKRDSVVAIPARDGPQPNVP